MLSTPGPNDAARSVTLAGTGQKARGRVIFLVRLHHGAQDRFLAAYGAIRHIVAGGVPGHVVDQVCQSPDDPLDWLITSEWESLDCFLDWERTAEHRELARPLRDCIENARSLRFAVCEETRAVGASW